MSRTGKGTQVREVLWSKTGSLPKKTWIKRISLSLQCLHPWIGYRSLLLTAWHGVTGNGVEERARGKGQGTVQAKAVNPAFHSVSAALTGADCSRWGRQIKSLFQAIDSRDSECLSMGLMRRRDRRAIEEGSASRDRIEQSSDRLKWISTLTLLFTAALLCTHSFANKSDVLTAATVH